ncbi:hypothetical protein LT493_21740 [Streptomyces tricolor]|nr:hypothetical protein [Streptomyces tricolor]
MLGVLSVPSTAARLLPAAPRLLARAAAPAVGLAAGAAAGTARAGVRGADAAARVARVARNALPGAGDHWRAGARAHLAVRPLEQEHARRAGGTGHLARRMAEALADHPDVVLAYWDQGLARLVVTATGEEAAERVMDHAAGLRRAARPRPGGRRRGGGHPSGRPDRGACRRGHARRRRRRDRRRLHRLRAAAAAHPPDGDRGRDPAAGEPALPRLAARAHRRHPHGPRYRPAPTPPCTVPARPPPPSCSTVPCGPRQVAETVARSAAFESVHDRLCAPDRVSLAPVPDGPPRPPLRASPPAQEYAAHASAGSVLGAAATLLVKHDAGEAAEAVLAGSPKAARYGPAAFHAPAERRPGPHRRPGPRPGTAARTGDGRHGRPCTRAPCAPRTASPTRGPSRCWTRPAGPGPGRRRGTIRPWRTSPVSPTRSNRRPPAAGRRRACEARGDEGAVLVVARVHRRRARRPGALRAADVAIALPDRDGAVVWGADILALHGLPGRVAGADRDPGRPPGGPPGPDPGPLRRRAVRAARRHRRVRAAEAAGGPCCRGSGTRPSTSPPRRRCCPGRGPRWARRRPRAPHPRPRVHLAPAGPRRGPGPAGASNRPPRRGRSRR